MHFQQFVIQNAIYVKMMKYKKLKLNIFYQRDKHPNLEFSWDNLFLQLQKM